MVYPKRLTNVEKHKEFIMHEPTILALLQKSRK